MMEQLGENNGANSKVPSYAVQVHRFSHGSVRVSTKKAAKNAIISITATSDNGYALKNLTVLDANGNALALINASNEKYLQMPSSSVTIYSTFVPVEDKPMAFLMLIPATGSMRPSIMYVTTNSTDTIFAPNHTMGRAMLITSQAPATIKKH